MTDTADVVVIGGGINGAGVAYHRFTQGGMNDAWWSIQELNVYGATGTENACPTGTGPTGPTCTTPHTT